MSTAQDRKAKSFQRTPDGENIAYVAVMKLATGEEMLLGAASIEAMRSVWSHYAPQNCDPLDESRLQRVKIAQMHTATRICTDCGADADGGEIYCWNCKAQIPHDITDPNIQTRFDRSTRAQEWGGIDR